MNVNELYRLAEWFDDRYSSLSKLYQDLQKPLQHNANQPNKQPVEEKVIALTDLLEGMSFEELSLQQLDLLENLGVADFIGPRGSRFVDTTIRTSDFDPATAVQKIQEAIASINDAHRHLIGYRDAVDALGMDVLDFEGAADSITIRVGFRNDASIDNITDWKASAKEWYDIIRGLALASGEPPESTKVVGAGTGSIILFLTATAAVTTLLAIISKNVTGVAKNIIEVQSATEELRQKKILTKVMESELVNQVKELKQSALDRVLADVKGQLPELGGEAENALTNSIKRLLAFNEKGGNVDFVTPAEDLDEEASESPEYGDAAALAQARVAIQEYQAARDDVKLLISATNDD